jgi:hypothetical protein
MTRNKSALNLENNKENFASVRELISSPYE